MQPRQRRAILSAALDLPPGKEVTRDTVKAAIWSAFGFTDDSENRVSLVLAVVDAYTDARSRRAIHTWAGHEVPLPPLNADLAQHAAVRRTLTALTTSVNGYAQLQAQRQLHHGVIQVRPALSVVPLAEEHQEALASLIEPVVPVASSHRKTATKFDGDDLADFVKWLNSSKDKDDNSPIGILHPANAEDIDDDDENQPRYECNTCGAQKKEYEYYRSKSVKRGFDHQCKECKNKKGKEYRENKKQRQLVESLQEMTNQSNATGDKPDDIHSEDHGVTPVAEAS